MRFPCTYPPDELYGRLLAGVGVPDLRGGQGTSTFYSSAHEVKAHASENVVRLPVPLGAESSLRTHLIGPRNPRTGEDFHAEITLRLEPGRRAIRLLSDGEPKTMLLHEGVWSDWLHVRFKTGLLQAVHGTVRFYLVRSEPLLELYASPVNFAPDAPLFPISAPPTYAKELAAKLGTFYTTGMAEDHSGYNNERLSAEAFLAQCDLVLEERRQMLRYELERLREGLLFCLFDTPDRLQHMFWRDGAATVQEHYRTCDRIIGETLNYVDDETLCIVLSDHGMNSFERSFNLNTWLHEQGLLVLERGYAPGPEAGAMLRHVDWSRTQAYALGLSGLYLNRAGREAQGIVNAAEAQTLKQKLAQALTGLGDSQRNRVAIHRAVLREEVFNGAYADEAPDLLLNYASGYRVAWASSLGGLSATSFEDNVKKWSGDHLLDPALVPGVLLMNRPFRGAQASLLDLAPTILAALGVPKGSAMEGENLLL